MTEQLKIEDITISAELGISAETSAELSVSAGEEIYTEKVIVEKLGGTTDYEKLSNLPSLDGTKIIGNVKERDPTVPLWAKSTSKPVYTPDEIEMKPIALTDLEALFNNL
jgi:hypothetical protein